jgi:hypothetical protein
MTLSEKFGHLRNRVEMEDITTLAKEIDLFGGAGIVITDKPGESEQDSNFYPVPLTVVTPFARELSWLIFQLGGIMSGTLDYMNKYDFYGRLAERAILSTGADGNNLKMLLLDVIDEAEMRAAEND